VARNIDDVIRVIRRSENRDDARQRLMRRFKLSEQQAQAILDMPLGRLTRLDQTALKDEYRELIKQIEYWRSLLRHPRQLMEVIKDELRQVKRAFGDPRRTVLIPEEPEEASIEDLIELQDLVITITRDGYIKRVPLNTYRVQRRGGRGIIALSKKEEDIVSHVFVATTHHTILFFTNLGKCYQLKAYEVPVASRQARGTPIVNLVQLDEGERIVATVPIPTVDINGYLFMCTRRGVVKKTPLEQFHTRLARGVQATRIADDDELCWVRWTDGEREILIATEQGMVIRFSEQEVRPMGRQATGVRGIRLRADDRVAAMDVIEPGATEMLIVTERGYGKRTKLDTVRRIGRGGRGVVGVKVTKRNGKLIALHVVRPDDEVMLITAKGVLIRERVKAISISGRAAQGVRLIRLDQDDRVADAALVVSSDSMEVAANA
ncbi:MAG TPA: DNA gyrase subunit A, partial [Armatimonadetes bacterium]|nr:DNA gyrase subunit A [Armatimonadota bacterium]